MSKFLELFNVKKPVIGMLHLNIQSETREKTLELAKRELNTYLENGIDAVIVENYFGDVKDVENMLQYLSENRRDVNYGINVLGDYHEAFRLAKKYNAKFIQIDSVSGHLESQEDIQYEKQLSRLRESVNIPVIGGVRFKYQPYLSGRTLEEDLRTGMTRCDGIVVTGDATGVETDKGTIRQFRSVIGDFPLIIGAGLTPQNCNSLLIADAAIVGSYVKDNHRDTGIVSAENVKELMNAIKEIREKAVNNEIKQSDGDFDR